MQVDSTVDCCGGIEQLKVTKMACIQVYTSKISCESYAMCWRS